MEIAFFNIEDYEFDAELLGVDDAAPDVSEFFGNDINNSFDKTRNITAATKQVDCQQTIYCDYNTIDVELFNIHNSPKHNDAAVVKVNQESINKCKYNNNNKRQKQTSNCWNSLQEKKLKVSNLLLTKYSI